MPTETVPERPPGDRSTELLMDLASAMHASASPADVAEERLHAVATALGLDAQFVIMQSFLATELRRGGRRAALVSLAWTVGVAAVVFLPFVIVQALTNRVWSHRHAGPGHPVKQSP